MASALVLLFVLPGLAAEGGAALDLAAINAYVERSVKAARIPSLSLAVVEEGRTVLLKGYGEAGPGQPATADTVYYLGSTTKAFTALAVMRLVEEGRVGLDAPYRSYVPEFRLADEKAAGAITVRELLNHTSGLSDKGLSSPSTGEASLEAELERLKDCRLASEPGSRYFYYNPNYRLLGLLIERVSGKSYADFLEEELFSPLGMTSSGAGELSETWSGRGSTGAGFSREGSARGAVSQGLHALGHMAFLGLPVRRDQDYRAGALPSGYISSSARDLGLFLEAELGAAGQGGKPGKVGNLGPAALAETWLAPAGVSGYEAGTRYGMGWMLMDNEMGKFLFHGGALENYQSALYLDPEGRRGFAILMGEGDLSAQASLGSLQSGLVDLLRDRPVASAKASPLPVILGLFLFAMIAIESLRWARLGKWRLRAAKRKPLRNFAGAGLELALALFLALGLLPLGNALAGEVIGWQSLWGLFPEIALGLWIAIASAMVHGILKAIILARFPKAQAEAKRVGV
jgi:CubicO group peptidase (beta-lactamase class C family)